MKIIGQDLRFDVTIAVGDKLAATVKAKEKRKKYALVLFDCRKPEPAAATYDARKGLVREEANSIRTAYRRTDFLPEPDRA